MTVEFREAIFPFWAVYWEVMVAACASTAEFSVVMCVLNSEFTVALVSESVLIVPFREVILAA